MKMRLKIVKDKQHKGMWRIKWPDGTISVNTPNPDRPGGHYGFYNKTRAKELARRLEGVNLTEGLSWNASVGQLEAH